MKKESIFSMSTFWPKALLVFGLLATLFVFSCKKDDLPDTDDPATDYAARVENALAIL